MPGVAKTMTFIIFGNDDYQELMQGKHMDRCTLTSKIPLQIVDSIGIIRGEGFYYIEEGGDGLLF